MNQANISYARNHLSALLDQVKAGETVLIVDRRRPVARLEPAGTAELASGPEADLMRRGLLRPARRRLDRRALRALPLPACKGHGDILAALLKEREAGR